MHENLSEPRLSPPLERNTGIEPVSKPCRPNEVWASLAHCVGGGRPHTRLFGGSPAFRPANPERVADEATSIPGATDGNRTHVSALGRPHTTIVLRSHSTIPDLIRPPRLDGKSRLGVHFIY